MGEGCKGVVEAERDQKLVGTILCPGFNQLPAMTICKYLVGQIIVHQHRPTQS